MQIIVPKRYVGLTPFDIVVFLAGPVLGGESWQQETIEYFVTTSVRRWPVSYCERILPRIKFVSPCRWGDNHPLARYFVSQYSVIDAKGVIEAGQTYMEIHYLLHILRRQVSGKPNGLAFFGLFPESKQNPRTDGVPYATDTRGELGRYTTLAKYEGTLDSLFIGVHPDFVLGATRSNLQYFSGDGWLKSNWREIYNSQNLADWIADSIQKYF